MDADHARERLQERRREIEDAIRAARSGENLDEGQADSIAEFDPDDAADIGSEMFERERTYSVVVGLEGHLKDVDDALRRVDDGSFGVCEVCREAIPEERLEVRPEARFCVQHQEEVAHR